MTCRFIYDNLITDPSMITVSSLRTGIVSDAIKEGSGSAVITALGSYSGIEDKEYTCEIDSIAGGAEVGQATFKWSNGGGVWDASGVTTDSSNITLENGVIVKWTTGAGADFVVGDAWYFKAVLPFGANKAIDLDRDARLRTQLLEAPNTFTINLGSAQEIKALIIYDHNFSSGATLTLKGHTSDAWGAPDFSEVVTWKADKILHFLSASTTKQYWRLEVSDVANEDFYLEIGELYLGSYLEPKNYMWSPIRSRNEIISTNTNPYGKKRHRYFNTGFNFRYSFRFTNSDITNITTMLGTLSDKDTGIINPLFWVPNISDTSDFWMVDFHVFEYEQLHIDNYPCAIELEEVQRSV